VLEVRDKVPHQPAAAEARQQQKQKQTNRRRSKKQKKLSSQQQELWQLLLNSHSLKPRSTSSSFLASAVGSDG
jgi:hypothetical protein